jgi:hypothetical protein
MTTIDAVAGTAEDAITVDGTTVGTEAGAEETATAVAETEAGATTARAGTINQRAQSPHWGLFFASRPPGRHGALIGVKSTHARFF